jgi:hypothetical protein
MKSYSRKVVYGIAVAIMLLLLLVCKSKGDVLKQAEETVRSFIIYYATNPFAPHPPKYDLMHQDYLDLGVEGTRISLIARDIEIDETKWVRGSFNIHEPHEEDAIEVTVTMRQLFSVSDLDVKRDEKVIRRTYVLSNYNVESGKYLILGRSYFSYDIYFEEAMREYLASEKGKSEYPTLRRELSSAGMEGL